jgi:hypothetical protein
MTKRLRVIWLLAAILLLSWPAQAMMVHLDLKDLAGMSEVAVKAIVGGKTCDWTSDHQIIYTEVVLSNCEQITKTGLVPLPPLTVRVYGGVVGDDGLTVSDQPRFDPGQQVVVFLKHVTSGDMGMNYFIVAGGYQGKFTVDSLGKIVELNSVPTTDTTTAPADETSYQDVHQKSHKVTLENFIKRIQTQMP